jgi:hypothetical protein
VIRGAADEPQSHYLDDCHGAGPFVGGGAWPVAGGEPRPMWLCTLRFAPFAVPRCIRAAMSLRERVVSCRNRKGVGSPPFHSWVHAESPFRLRVRGSVLGIGNFAVPSSSALPTHLARCVYKWLSIPGTDPFTCVSVRTNVETHQTTHSLQTAFPDRPTGRRGERATHVR